MAEVEPKETTKPGSTDTPRNTGESVLPGRQDDLGRAARHSVARSGRNQVPHKGLIVAVAYAVVRHRAGPLRAGLIRWLHPATPAAEDAPAH